VRWRRGSVHAEKARWQKARRVVAKVEWHWDRVLPKVGFIVTNLRWRLKKIDQKRNSPSSPIGF